jgi:hypothetical protein
MGSTPSNHNKPKFTQDLSGLTAHFGNVDVKRFSINMGDYTKSLANFTVCSGRLYRNDKTQDKTSIRCFITDSSLWNTMVILGHWDELITSTELKIYLNANHAAYNATLKRFISFCKSIQRLDIICYVDINLDEVLPTEKYIKECEVAFCGVDDVQNCTNSIFINPRQFTSISVVSHFSDVELPATQEQFELLMNHDNWHLTTCKNNRRNALRTALIAMEKKVKIPDLCDLVASFLLDPKRI